MPRNEDPPQAILWPWTYLAMPWENAHRINRKKEKREKQKEEIYRVCMRLLVHPNDLDDGDGSPCCLLCNLCCSTGYRTRRTVA